MQFFRNQVNLMVKFLFFLYREALVHLALAALERQPLKKRFD